MRRSFLKILAACALVGSAAVPALAQTPWPARPIKLVVPLPPGGGGDVTARVVAAELTQRLKQTVVVENRPGAGSAIGTQAVARAEPDGYTFLMITDFHSINAALNAEKMLPAPLPYDSLKDFTPVSRLVNLQIMLLANPRLGARNLQAVMAQAKAAPEQVSAGSPGLSSPHHVAFLMLQEQARVKLLEVPFQGSGPAVVALMGGQVDLVFSTVGQGQQLAQEGKAVPIAVSGSTRDPRAPEVPTIAESGFPGFAVWSWMGVVAPAGTPAPIVARLNQEITQVLRDPEVLAKLGNAGMIGAPSTADEFGQVIRRDAEKMQALFRTGKKK
jgi:tripartite-type tricarboxylate transporter receptor subunit TctC